MKKSKRLVVCITAIVVIVLFAVAYFFFPIKPFSRLRADNVQQILVYAVPPDVQVELTTDEMAEAVNLLKNLTVHQRNYKADLASGQAVRFTIIYTDGANVEIAISANESLTLNGRTYRTNYESADALHTFANQVVK